MSIFQGFGFDMCVLLVIVHSFFRLRSVYINDDDDDDDDDSRGRRVLAMICKCFICERKNEFCKGRIIG